jgi:hypothetical protein
VVPAESASEVRRVGYSSWCCPVLIDAVFVSSPGGSNLRRQHFLAALAILLAAVASGYAQSRTGSTDAKIERLLAQSLGSGFEASYWLPDSEEPAHVTEALGVVYIPIKGSAGSVSIEAGYFKRSGKIFQFGERVRDLFGMEPRDARFLPGRIELTTTMLKPGEPRCCPSGTARWAIDRKSLVATRIR